MKIKADFEYVTGTDGFTAIMPNTVEAVATYNAIFTAEFYRLTPHELKAFKSQAHKDGYTIRKATPISIDFSDDLLAKLVTA